MKEIEVKINNLGRVRNSTIKIAPLMVFSGESGLGKSYVAILCHYFFELMVNSSRMNQFFIDNGYSYSHISKGLGDLGVALSIRKVDLEKWIADDAVHYLGYMLGHDKFVGDIEVKFPDSMPEFLDFTYKKELTGLVNAEDIDTILSLGSLSYRVQQNTQFEESPLSILLRYNLVDEIFEDFQSLSGTFVLPPSRGPVLSEQIIPRSGMYLEFRNDLDKLNQAKPRPVTASKDIYKLSLLIKNIQEGVVKRVENEYVYNTEKVSMPVSAAAASVKEIAPLQILVSKTDVSKCAVLIEEPEAHLHPTKQRMMGDIVGAFSHCGTVLQVTTHSDYFLRRLNELMLFDKVSKRPGISSRMISKLSKETGIARESAIDVSKVRAYLLERQEDGTSRVVEQNLTDGIPFTSFREAIVNNLTHKDVLEEALGNETE